MAVVLILNFLNVWMVLVENEYGVIVRIAVSFFQADGAGGLQFAHKGFWIVLFTKHIAQFPEQRRQIYFLVLPEVLFGNLNRPAGHRIIDRSKSRGWPLPGPPATRFARLAGLAATGRRASGGAAARQVLARRLAE